MSLRNGDLDGDGRSEIPVTSPWGLGVLELVGGSLQSPIMARNGTRFDGWLLNTADNRFDLTADIGWGRSPRDTGDQPVGHRRAQTVGRHF